VTEENIKSKAENQVLEALRGSIRRIMNDAADHLAAGGCQDYSQYSHQTGVIKGLAIAERELLELDDLMLRE
jgi:hypothetical protein